MWARANGVDSVVLGITFMEELLGVFVRADDPAESVADLAGRRLALPVWPRLVFNFWRFAALKGLHSALAVHGLRDDDVEFVDIVEGWDPHERSNVGRSDPAQPARCEYRNQLQALLAGEVDAIFGKGPEAALLQREAGGRIRLLYDLRRASAVEHRVNNSTPRLLTTSRHLVDRHFAAVVRYVRTLIRAARWTETSTIEARRLIARECSVGQDEIETCLESGYAGKLLPRVSDELVEALAVMKSFLHERRFIARDFELEDWIDSRALNRGVPSRGARRSRFNVPRARRRHLQHEVRPLRLVPQHVRVAKPRRRPHHHVHVRRHHRPGVAPLVVQEVVRADVDIDSLRDPGQRIGLVRRGEECAHRLPVVRRHAATPPPTWSSANVRAVRSPARRRIGQDCGSGGGPIDQRTAALGTRSRNSSARAGGSGAPPVAIGAKPATGCASRGRADRGCTG